MGSKMGPSKEYYIRLQQLQNRLLQKYKGTFQSNQGNRNQILSLKQNYRMFKARKPQLPVNQYRKRIPPYQNFQKIRKLGPKLNKPGSQAPQIRNISQAQIIQKVRRRFPNALRIPKVRKPFPQSLLNQNTQRRPSQAQMNQNIQRPLNQAQIKQKFQGRVLQAMTNQKVQGQFPQTQVNRKFHGRVSQPQVSQKLQEQFPQTQVNQKFQGRVLQAQGNQKVKIPNRPPFRGIPNQNRSRNIRHRTSQMPIKIFTPQELLQMAPGSDKKLWELIVSRLPASYTIPDVKFIHLYQAFNKQKR